VRVFGISNEYNKRSTMESVQPLKIEELQGLIYVTCTETGNVWQSPLEIERDDMLYYNRNDAWKMFLYKLVRD